MSWGLVAAGVSTAASLYTGSQAAGAASDAADAQSASAAAQIGENSRQYNQTRQDNMPFLNTGTAANQRLSYLLGLGDKNAPDAGGGRGYQLQDFVDYANRAGVPANFTDANTYGSDLYRRYMDRSDWNGASDTSVAAWLGKGPTYAPVDQSLKDSYGSLTRKFSLADRDADPVYQSGLQFGLDEGTKAINARALAGGGYDSGATLKALTKYGNDYGSTKANDSYNRYTQDNTNIYNKLAGVSGTGQVAASQVGSAGQAATSGISQAIGDAGNARAAGIVGGANAWSNAAGNINSAYNSYNSNQTLQKLLARGNTGSTGYTGWQMPGQYDLNNPQYG